MKNKYFKYSMILVALSVSVGVALFGFNTAFGVVTPTQTPETSSTVAPTFSGLKVTGTATLDKAVTVGSGAKPANLEVNGETKSNGDIDLNGNLDVETTATIHSFLYAWGDAIFHELLTVKKGLQVDGGNIEFPSITGGSIANLLGFTGALNKNISLETKSPTGLLRSSLKIRGDGVINQVDIGTAARSNNLQVYGNIKGTGLTLSSDVENFSFSPNLGTIGPSSISSTRGINISTGKGQALSVSSSSGPALLSVAGTVEIGSDLKVSGHATATKGFGKYMPRKPSTSTAIPTGKWGQAVVACEPEKGEILISCSGNTYSNSVWTDAKDTPLTQVLSGSDNKSCYAAAFNNSEETRYVRAFAICMNPNL